MKYDTVVIGSGASGLCAALALARHGQRVALVERCARLTPLLRRFNREGWWCDAGLHHAGGLHPTGPLSVLLRYLGVGDAIRTVPMNPDGYDIIHTGDGEPVRLPVGIGRVEETLVRHYPRSRRAVRAYLERIKAIHSQSAFLHFGLSDGVSPARETFSPHESLADFLTAHDAEPALHHMLSRYGHFIYGANGIECPMTMHAMVLGSFYFSAHALARGGDEIVDAFERGLDQAGADVLCGRAVVGLEVDEHRQLRGVRLSSDEVLECRTCVCTIHPKLLPALVEPGIIRPSYLARIEEADNTFGPMGVFLASEKPPAELERSNAFFVGGEANLDSADAGFAALNWGTGGGQWGTGDDQAGRKSLCLMRTCPPTLFQPDRTAKREYHDEAYEQLKCAETERLVEAFYRRYPDQRGRCRVLDAATPCTFASYTSTVAGSAYGLKHSVRQVSLEARTPVKDLYLAGQSVLTPGLMGVMISALLAVSRIIGAETVLGGLRKCR